jgi:hypothetical protein
MSCQSKSISKGWRLGEHDVTFTHKVKVLVAPGQEVGVAESPTATSRASGASDLTHAGSVVFVPTLRIWKRVCDRTGVLALRITTVIIASTCGRIGGGFEQCAPSILANWALFPGAAAIIIALISNVCNCCISNEHTKGTWNDIRIVGIWRRAFRTNIGTVFIMAMKVRRFFRYARLRNQVNDRSVGTFGY